MKKTLKKLSLHRETILDLGHFRVSGGVISVNPTRCTTTETTTATETTTSVNTGTVTTLNSWACTQT
jgi:hypothetical protein